MSEFVSNDYRALHVSKYLQTIKYFFEKRTNETSIAAIIVTDLSFSLINAVMETFNRMTLSHYLSWTYKVLIDHKNDTRIQNICKTRPYLCSTHFLKSIIVKAKKLNPALDKPFIFAFTLLQNSVTVEQFNTTLLNVYNVFNTDYFDEIVFDSLSYLKKELSDRRLESLNIGKLNYGKV